MAALVLVPFAALVVLGFWFSEPELPLPAPAGSAATPLTMPDAAVAPLPDPLPARGEREPNVSEPIRAVTTEARRCFDDNQLTGTIRVRFTPNRDGGYDDVTVESNPTQNPYIAACLEDVFAELRFVPAPGERYEPTTHTFNFGPRKD